MMKENFLVLMMMEKYVNQIEVEKEVEMVMEIK